MEPGILTQIYQRNWLLVLHGLNIKGPLELGPAIPLLPVLGNKTGYDKQYCSCCTRSLSVRWYY